MKNKQNDIKLEKLVKLIVINEIEKCIKARSGKLLKVNKHTSKPIDYHANNKTKFPGDQSRKLRHGLGQLWFA